MKQGHLPDRKVFSLTSSHHERRKTEKIVKEAKSCFSFLPMNQSTPERSLTIEKGTHYLSIICENYIFQDPIDFL